MEIIKGNLYRSKDNGLVVMASTKLNENVFSGQVVVGDESHRKGKFSTAWIKDAFQPYSAEIIIKEVIDFSKVQFVELNDGEVVLTDGIEKFDNFLAVNLKTGNYNAFEKSEAKRVVTPNFK
jgi:hypothetical protein